MTNDELDRSLRQLRLGGMADALSIRSQQARARASDQSTLSACSCTTSCSDAATASSSGASKRLDFVTNERSTRLTGSSTRSIGR